MKVALLGAKRERPPARIADAGDFSGFDGNVPFAELNDFFRKERERK